MDVGNPFSFTNNVSPLAGWAVDLNAIDGTTRDFFNRLVQAQLDQGQSVASMPQWAQTIAKPAAAPAVAPAPAAAPGAGMMGWWNTQGPLPGQMPYRPAGADMIRNLPGMSGMMDTLYRRPQLGMGSAMPGLTGLLGRIYGT